jgi:hypothetical protein
MHSHVSTIALTLLAVLVGAVALLLSLAAYTTRHASRTVADMRQPRLHTFAEGAMPAWVEAKLAPLRARFSALGFRQLVSYTRESQRLNYTIVLVSERDHTSVHLWVARYSGVMRWLTFLHSWRSFVGDMLVVPRWSLQTYYDGDRRYESTPVDLSSMSVPGLTEHVQLPEDMSASDALREHASGAKAFSLRTGAVPFALTSVEQFLETERVLCGQVADRLQQTVASARATPRPLRPTPRLVILWVFLVLGFSAMWRFLSR